MRTLIIYATKNGATKKIAELLAASLGAEVTLQDIGEGPTTSAFEYDCVVLGSPLTAGMIRKEIKQFAANNADTLKEKRLGLYVSGLQGDGEAKYFEENFPAELLEAARAKAFLGGIFDPDKCGFVARKIIKTIAKLESYTSTIDEEKIRQFAALLSQ